METRTVNGDPLNVSVLGYPAENDWILHGPYSDKSLMRNVLIYRLANKMGRYATRTRFCELYINGEYMGVYVFMEKIKRDNNRVDIAKLLPADTLGDELTGGYILKIDKFTGNSYPGWQSNYTTWPGNWTVTFQYHDPEEPELHPLQKQYIQAYVDSFETSLASPTFADTVSGFRKYADEASFIDFFIANEITKNVDGYRLSTFFYKDKNSKDPRIHMGPIWDFNLGWGNANYCGGGDTTGWAYLFNYICGSEIPFWWERLMQDTLFQNNLRCRWESLRTTILHTDSVWAMIDSSINVLGPAIDREFYRWPRLGMYVWPNNYVGQTYADEINYLKTWIQARLTWLDKNIPGKCITPPQPNNVVSASRPSRVTLFPNPCKDFISIETAIPDKTKKVVIMDMYGKIIREIYFSAATLLIDTSMLPAGTYGVLVKDDNAIPLYRGKIVKI